MSCPSATKPPHTTPPAAHHTAPHMGAALAFLFVLLLAHADAKRGCVNFGHSCYGGMGKRASTGVEDTPAALGEEVRYLPQSGDPALVFTGPRGSVYKPDSATKELARQQQVENVSKVIRQWIQNYRRAQELSNDLV
ncbi:unnamed protein product [Callosobruchus maculatus]|uniref:Uncharacterized protein n=1 Tax=Callosobruchus maculatus TaxID=64391 RepID=A0A653DQV4_CALMS|nr:unnamed protein product [Callosobruchus maculatus]